MKNGCSFIIKRESIAIFYFQSFCSSLLQCIVSVLLLVVKDILLTCHDCDAFQVFIGQTGRSFKTRYSEHVRALNRLNRSDSINLESTSAYDIHLHESNHSASNNNPIPIHFERKRLILGLLEFTEIKLALSNNFNILNNQLEVIKIQLLIISYNK